jgi:3-hydroxyisobutyrate dehydrogenase-like beta-hydroxyacid dehydrogenase
VWPLFQVLGEHIFHLGDVGMGMTAKVINNQMSHVIMVAIAEGFAMAVEKGLDPRVLYKAISLSSGNSHQLHDRFYGRILPRNFAAGMKVDLAYKDSELALDLGRETQTPLFVTSAAHTVYELARTKGLGEFDYAAIVRLWEEWMGINMSGGE